jgi:predicted Zn-dependent protease
VRYDARAWWVGGLALLLLAGCMTIPATGKQTFSLVSREAERDVGQNTAEQALKLYGQYRPSSRATSYVTDLCQRLWAVTESAADPLQCLVLDSETFNAWATPGYINIYRGLLPYMQSEAELMAVMAHESGHVTARHIGQQITAQTLGGILATAVTVYAASASDDDRVVSTVAQVGGVAAGLGLASYSRSHEYEADILGQRYMQRMGYDPREAVRMMDNLQTKEVFDTRIAAAFNDGKPPSNGGLSALFASHPMTPARRAKLVANAGGEPDGSLRLPEGITPATPRSDPQGRRRYHAAIDGLLYGPQQRWGIAGRDYIALPSARLMWRLPDGFVIQYVASDKPDTMGTWVGVHPQSGVTFRMTLSRYKAGLNPGFALEKLYPGLDNMQRFQVGGDAAPTAYTGVLNTTTRVVAVPAPHEDSLAVLSFTYPTHEAMAREEGTLMSTLQQSRFVGTDAAKNWQPLRVQTFTAAVGDSVERRARRLPTGAFGEMWFRALNGLQPDQELRVGEVYKTIVDDNALSQPN